MAKANYDFSWGGSIVRDCWIHNIFKPLRKCCLLMALYEIGVFNQWIRNYTRSGTADEMPDNLKHIDPAFESVLYFHREARSKDILNAKLEREFPKADGYIIDFKVKVSD